MTVDVLVVLVFVAASVMWIVFDIGALIVRYAAEDSP